MVKNPPANARDLRCRFNPWTRKIPWRRKWQPTLVFLPRESMDREAWWATVHRVTKSWTRLKQVNTNACTREWLTFVEEGENFLYPSRFFC